MENGARDNYTVIKHYLKDIELLENIHRRFRKIVKVLAGNMFESQSLSLAKRRLQEGFMAAPLEGSRGAALISLETEIRYDAVLVRHSNGLFMVVDMAPSCQILKVLGQNSQTQGFVLRQSCVETPVLFFFALF